MADNVIVRVPEQQFIRGEDGYSPEVTIENIAHGHSVTITDRDHPNGQNFNVLDGDSAYEQAVAGGYTGTEAQFNEELASFKELSEQAANSAQQAAGGASTAQYYMNSAWNAVNSANLAKVRAEAAADQALIRMNSADQSAQSAAGSASNASRDAGTASTAATTATTKAGEASDSATAADGSAKDAEAYAIGKRGGTDVGSTDPAYHNNAKYYAEQAASSASDAVTAKGAAETAQGKAEDAQEAAEQAQEAAEAVLESIPPDYTELSEDVDDLKSAFNASDVLIFREPTLDYSIGNLRVSNGEPQTASNRCRTWYFPISANIFVNDIPDNIKLTFRFYHYDIDLPGYVFDGYTDYITDASEAQNAIDSTESTILRVVFGYTDDRSMSGMTDFSDFSSIIMYRHNRYDNQEIPFYLKGTIELDTSAAYRSTPYILLKRGDTVHYSVWMRGEYKYMAVYSVNKVEKYSKLGTKSKTLKFEETYTATEEYEYIRLSTMHSSNQYYVEDGYGVIENLFDTDVLNTISDKHLESSILNRKPLAILCAKEIRYNDGTKPTIEFYVLADSNQNIYISYDLADKYKIFTFNGNINRYKFGVRKNNDIIAVYRNEFDTVTAEYGASLDNIRRNPFVFIAKEHYKTQHEVDFGTFNPSTQDGLKPTGWLENVGFCSLPNGDIIFVEYTKEGVVYTANCWKISANSDIKLPASWAVKKQFLVAQNDQLDLDDTYIEHIHSVQHDPYTGTVYVTTGDLDKKAQIYYSTDNCETFSRQSFVDPTTGNTVNYGQKLFRLLNINFAKDDVYWSSDSSSEHVVIHCERSANGGLQPDSISVLATLPNLSGTPATYGSVYFEELNAIVLMESCDTAYTEMAFRVFDLTTNTTKTMCTIKSVGGTNRRIGFRTEYTEFDPIDGIIKVGYGNGERYANQNAICGNAGGNSWLNNTNNLNIRVFAKADGSFMAKFGCYYL